MVWVPAWPPLKLLGSLSARRTLTNQQDRAGFGVQVPDSAHDGFPGYPVDLGFSTSDFAFSASRTGSGSARRVARLAYPTDMAKMCIAGL